MSTKQTRPSRETGASNESLGARLTSKCTGPDLQTLAARESYVVRVAVTLTNGQTRTQHYASLHAAVKAEERARARGCSAVLALARVVPVGIIVADELDTLRGDL